MSGQPTGPSASLIALVEDVLAQLEGSAVTECELHTGDYRILLRRSPVSAPIHYESLDDAGDVVPETWRAVFAPLTGIFYLSESPQSPPFVTVGDVVSERQVVGLIESMKMFNPVESDVTGTLRSIVVTGQQVVERGQVLMYLEPLEEVS